MDDNTTTPKKTRKSAAGRKLMRWNPDVDQLLMLAIDYTCTKEGVVIPWNEVANIVDENLSGEAIKQHLVKVRAAREAAGHKVPEKLDRAARRKSKAITASTTPIKRKRGKKSLQEEPEDDEEPSPRISSLLFKPETPKKARTPRAKKENSAQKTPSRPSRRKSVKVKQEVGSDLELDTDVFNDPDGDYGAPGPQTRSGKRGRKMQPIEKDEGLGSDADEDSIQSPLKKMKVSARRSRDSSVKYKESIGSGEEGGEEGEEDEENLLAQGVEDGGLYDQEEYNPEEASPLKEESNFHDDTSKAQMPPPITPTKSSGSSSVQSTPDHVGAYTTAPSANPYYDAANHAYYHGNTGVLSQGLGMHAVNTSYGGTFSPVQDFTTGHGMHGYNDQLSDDKVSNSSLFGNIPITLSPSIRHPHPYSADQIPTNIGAFMPSNSYLYGGNHAGNAANTAFGDNDHTGLTPAMSMAEFGNSDGSFSSNLSRASTHSSLQLGASAPYANTPMTRQNSNNDPTLAGALQMYNSNADVFKDEGRMDLDEIVEADFNYHPDTLADMADNTFAHPDDVYNY